MSAEDRTTPANPHALWLMLCMHEYTQELVELIEYMRECGAEAERNAYHQVVQRIRNGKTKRRA